MSLKREIIMKDTGWCSILQRASKHFKQDLILMKNLNLKLKLQTRLHQGSSHRVHLCNIAQHL